MQQPQKLVLELYKERALQIIPQKEYNYYLSMLSNASS